MYDELLNVKIRKAKRRRKKEEEEEEEEEEENCVAAFFCFILSQSKKMKPPCVFRIGKFAVEVKEGGENQVRRIRTKKREKKRIETETVSMWS